MTAATTPTTAATLIADLERRGITLARHGDRLRIVPAAELAEGEIETLRRHKAEILETLDPWDDARERERLRSVFDGFDTDWWPGAFEWAKAYRPDLYDRHDHRLEAVDTAWKTRNVDHHIQALRALREAVLEMLAEYDRDTSRSTSDPD